MEYIKVGFIIIFTALIIFLYYISGLFYIYIQSRRVKKGKKIFKIKSIFDVRIVILLILVLLLNTTKIFSSFYMSTFPDFEIEVSDNINDINFTNIYHEIKANIKVDKLYTTEKDSFSQFVIDVDGKIEKMVISFWVPRSGYCIYYHGVYKDKKIVFDNTTYYLEYDQGYFNYNLINALELIDKTNLMSIIKFSNSQDYIPGKDIKNYKFELNYRSKDKGYWSGLPNDDLNSPPFKGKFILEEDGDFTKEDGEPSKNFVGVFSTYYIKIENLESNKYEPGIVVFKNIN